MQIEPDGHEELTNYPYYCKDTIIQYIEEFRKTTATTSDQDFILSLLQISIKKDLEP